MKTLQRLVVLLAAAAATASAGIVLTFTPPTLFAATGTTAAFLATISNTGPDTVFLNGDSFNFSGSNTSFTVTDLFNTNVPFFVDASTTVTNVELFDIQVNAPFTDPLGAYPGNYTLIGGADGNAQDVLAQANFTLVATPEPATAGLFLCAAGALLLRRRRNCTAR
jgi:hypothetical protein